MDFRLAIITLPEFFSGETDCIARLSEAGAEYLHLRKPGCSETQMRDLIERIPPRYRRRLIVHRHFGLAKEYGLKGIHLSSSHENIPEGFEGMTIGRSCHTVEEASRFGKICDYVFLSPIFDSISKQGYRSAFSLEKLSVAFRDGSLGKNVMALGGIDDTNIVKVAETGFAGAALLGYIWGKHEIWEKNDIPEKHDIPEKKDFPGRMDETVGKFLRIREKLSYFYENFHL